MNENRNNCLSVMYSTISALCYVLYGNRFACWLLGILFSLSKENMPIIDVNRFRLLFKSHYHDVIILLIERFNVVR